MEHMTTQSRSIVVQSSDAGEITTHILPTTEEHIADGDVLIHVAYSSLNFKDGMALRGDRGVARTFPLVPGIDAVGTVLESDSERFQPGDKVIANGAGIGEFRHGGYTNRQRIHAISTVHLPANFSMHQAAAIGTAGYTAALSVNALIQHGVLPDHGPILVTGATGGVGSIAILLLHKLGYNVVAATGRVEEYSEYLLNLGADSIVDRKELSEKGKPLQRAIYAGVVDCVGSHTLVNACAQTKWGGVVTACGLAQGADLPGTVLPFILRGISLVGINSVDAPLEHREKAWELLSQTLDTEALDAMTTTIGLDDVIDAGKALMNNQLHGRTVVEID
ncbi:Mycocerosic acid synthase [Corynebacterium pseudotuberculosis]|nr:Mycocerosic acid synthase [Corynebacterium pseudotuberculosis]